MADDFFDDDYDPLAPPTVDDSVDGEAVDAGDAAQFDPDADPELGEGDDGGFAGADRIVRIWFDEQGRLDKVRVSPVWFKRLSPGQTLEQVFHQAFTVSRLGVTSQPEDRPIGHDDLDFGDLPPFSRATMEAYIAMMEDHQRRWNEAIARIDAAPVAKPRPAVGRSNGVTLTLDEFGHPASVRFDEDWLDEAQVGSICINVVAAAHRAYERYAPPADEHRSELESFQLEHDVLMVGFRKLLKPMSKR